MGTALVALLALAASPAADTVVRQYLGDAAGALQSAETALASAPDDASLRLAATCAAVELGELRRADALLAPLERRAPPRRAAVLRRLIERRQRSSKGALMRDLALAWRDAGRPDLAEEDPFIADALERALAPLATSTGLTPGERLLLAAPDPLEERRALAISAARDAKRNAFVVNLEILGVLAMLPCPPDPSEQRAAVARAMEAATSAQPSNGYASVAGWVAGCPGAMGTTAVAMLADAAARPTFELPRGRAFQELLAMAERADHANARLRAISAWLALDVPIVRLGALADAIDDAASRRAAGRVITTIGLRMAESTAWLERLQGLALAQRGAGLGGDVAEVARARERVESERAAYQEWAETSRSRGRWPFAAVWREWVPDEVGASRQLLRDLSETDR